MHCQNNTTNHSPCSTESSQSSTLEPPLEQSYVFGVHASAIPGGEETHETTQEYSSPVFGKLASAIPGGEEPQESTQEYSSPVFGKLAIDVADIPLPEGGKKKLNIPLTTPLGNVWK